MTSRPASSSVVYRFDFEHGNFVRYAPHDQIGQVALQNLNIALVRGGDQAVVKENDDLGTSLLFWRRLCLNSKNVLVQNKGYDDCNLR